MPRSTLTEAVADVRPRVVGTDGEGRFRLELISPGWGTSGYYSPEVLEAAGRAGVFSAGTHMYLDHPTLSDKIERPERSVRDLAAVLAEAATWDPDAGQDGAGALVADARVFGGYREVLSEMSDAIGVSVRALADVELGTAEGRRGQIVRELVEGKSVDFVTHPGRGGRIVQVLESAREVAEAGSIGQWLESRLHRDFTILSDDLYGDGRLTREERIALSSAIGDALNAFVATVQGAQPQLYERNLWEEPSDGPGDTIAEALEGRAPAVVSVVLARLVEAAPIDTETRRGRVVARWVNDAGDALHITDVPVTRPGTITEESDMPDIDAARLRELEEAHGRVPTLESERDAAVTRAETAESARVTAERERDAERARSAAATHVRTRVTEANGDLPEATVDRIVSESTATVPLTEAGALDTTALDTAADAARTREEDYLAGLAEAAGAGRPRFVTKRQPDTKTGGADVTESDVQAMIRRRAGTEKKGA